MFGYESMLSSPLYKGSAFIEGWLGMNAPIRQVDDPGAIYENNSKIKLVLLLFHFPE
jgi:hypothetical protein